MNVCSLLNPPSILKIESNIASKLHIVDLNETISQSLQLEKIYSNDLTPVSLGNNVTPERRKSQSLEKMINNSGDKLCLFNSTLNCEFVGDQNSDSKNKTSKITKIMNDLNKNSGNHFSAKNLPKMTNEDKIPKFKGMTPEISNLQNCHIRTDNSMPIKLIKASTLYSLCKDSVK